MLNAQRKQSPHGSVLIFGMVLVAILASISLAFATRIHLNEVHLEDDIAGSQALELAKTVTATKVRQMWSVYAATRTDKRVALLGGEDQNGNGVLDAGEDANLNGVMDAATAPSYSDADFVRAGYGQAKCTVTVSYLNKKESVDIKFSTIAQVANSMNGRYVNRRVEQTVRYGLGPATVFDYVYFANNYGWMYGTPLYLYGNMGANGNLGFSSGPTVDGKLFAALNAGISAAGVVNGTARFDTMAQYKALGATNILMRPTNPTAPTEDLNGNGTLDGGEDGNSNGKLDTHEYDIGYDGTQPASTVQTPLNMPYLGDLQMYKDLATASARPARPDVGEPTEKVGGIVKQLKAPGLDPTVADNYNILVDKTYGYAAGQNGAYSTVDGSGKVSVTNMTVPLDAATQQKNGNLALIGTAAQPLVILGPVVISNDLVIKGVIKGQGSFYMGRNTHVVGDLTYSNAPAWTQNDINFDTTTAANKLKDGVGFGTKGSVVMGNYTISDFDVARSYMQPPFTQPYVIDSSDADIGYSNTTVSGQPAFTGNYNSADGGKQYADLTHTPSTATRKFCESSFPASYINGIATKPATMMGIFYTNHYFGGRTSALKLYGATVMRDEGIVTDTSANWYYDPRISKADLSTYIQLYLPRTATYQLLMFREVPATN